jgi:hypothetical protein
LDKPQDFNGVQKLLYEEIWKQSFLIEIICDGGYTESFTFSLPPEGIEITIPQRVTETKTFGGVFIDDYGIDIGKIHLSGTTGNTNVKKVYMGKYDSVSSGSGSTTYLTGKEEMYQLRDNIILYKEDSRWKTANKAAVINLYNLGANYGGIDRNPDESRAFVDAWEVILKDFKITQNSSKPFTSAYSIDFTAVRILGGKTRVFRQAPRLSKPPDLKWYEKILKAIETWYGWSENVKNAVQDFRNAVARYSGEVERYLALVTGSIDNYMSALEKGVYTVTDVYNTFKRVTMAPADSALRMVQSTKRIRTAVEAMIKDIQSLPEQWSEKYGSVGKSVESEIAAYKNYFEDNMQELENVTNKAYAETVSGANPEVTIVPNTGTSPGFAGVGSGDGESQGAGGGSDSGTGTGDETGTGVDSGTAAGGGDETGAGAGTLQTVVAYGYIRHIATSETSLEKLAEFYLGDPDKAQVLAIMNGITGDDEINPGDQIKIPILSENSLSTLNQIFGSVNNRDALGIDIAIANGILQVGPNGDFVQQVDYENMKQAIDMRLSESVGNRIRLNTYGIRNVAGIPDSVAAAYICASIKDTVMQDPRVERVDNIYFRGTGDALFVSFDYYTYDGVKRTYEGAL